MSNVKAWPLPAGHPVEMPRQIVRPCDWGLHRVVGDLETQLGTIEAYNRLVAAAGQLKAKIDAGNAKPQHPMFAVAPGGG